MMTTIRTALSAMKNAIDLRLPDPTMQPDYRKPYGRDRRSGGFCRIRRPTGRAPAEAPAPHILRAGDGLVGALLLKLGRREVFNALRGIPVEHAFAVLAYDNLVATLEILQKLRPNFDVAAGAASFENLGNGHAGAALTD